MPYGLAINDFLTRLARVLNVWGVCSSVAETDGGGSPAGRNARHRTPRHRLEWCVQTHSVNTLMVSGIFPNAKSQFCTTDEPSERRVRREETPIDRRMTLIPEEPAESGRVDWTFATL